MVKLQKNEQLINENYYKTVQLPKKTTKTAIKRFL